MNQTNEQAWINYTNSTLQAIRNNTNFIVNPPSGSPHWWPLVKSFGVQFDAGHSGCWECSTFNESIYQAPLYDYSRCDKISGYAWFLRDVEHYTFNLEAMPSIKDMLDFCYAMDSALDKAYYWDKNFTAQKKSVQDRHNFPQTFDTQWNNSNINPAYVDPATNESSYYTFCGTYLELNSTWMQ